MNREQAQAILLGMAAVRGCRSFKRAALHGYCYQHDPERLRELEQPALIATAYLIKLALDNIPPNQWLSLLYEFTDGISEDLEAALLRVGHVEGWVNRPAALAHIGKRRTDVEAVAMALYCLRQFPDRESARKLVFETSDKRGACIMAAVSAARLGIEAVPINVIPPHHRAKLLALGAKLAENR